MRILITGGAGFIGSALVRYLINHTSATVMNIDKLTYAANLNALSEVTTSEQYHFKVLDICSKQGVQEILARFQPDAIMHLAAESHVDRSIDSPEVCIQTNIMGTYTLLEAARAYWQELPAARRTTFRFHQVSTDEVYGALDDKAAAFTEETAYAPNSPYSASKASADHLVRAWHRTYGLPILITHSSNNYGPYQHQEKLIPAMILNAYLGRPLSIYGDGRQVRDWLFVDDHVRALHEVLNRGVVGETYNIGGQNQLRNIEVVNLICSIMDELIPPNQRKVQQHADLIRFVTDRPGHDIRYAVDTNKIYHQLGWKAEQQFEQGLRKTIKWYLKYYATLAEGALG